jgi:hypothetical protein
MESGRVTAGLAELAPGPELAAALATIELAAVPNGEIITVSRQRAYEEARFLTVVAEVGRRDPGGELDEVARLARPARYGPDETRRSDQRDSRWRGVRRAQLPTTRSSWATDKVRTGNAQAAFLP